MRVIKAKKLALLWQSCATHLLCGISGGRETPECLVTGVYHGRTLYRKLCTKLEQKQSLFLCISPLTLKLL